ncbi:ATP-binding protein [Rhodococcus jostii]|uniref:ATP-binding protein n=1 Tax=Rhodococcus jostii TaxID=132919 RepID=UPI003667EAF8
MRISGSRNLRDLMFEPHPRFNILVGENEAGNSTLLEAIGLALTGRVNGRAAAEELNPFRFNQEKVDEFFRDRQAGNLLHHRRSGLGSSSRIVRSSNARCLARTTQLRRHASARHLPTSRL